VKFHPLDPNVLISGGWDNTIQIWDTRLQHSVRSIYGPHICGDSLDFTDNGEKIMSGAFSKEEQVKVTIYGNTYAREAS
jgi:WD40 repeat protein